MDISKVDPRLKEHYKKAIEIRDGYVAIMKVDPSLIQIWDDVAMLESVEDQPMVYMMFNSVMVMVQTEGEKLGVYIAPNINGNPAMLAYESAVIAREFNARTTDIIAIDPSDGQLYQGEEEAWNNHHEMLRNMALDLVNQMAGNIAEQKEQEAEQTPDLQV
ncbi:hypothetical protein [Vibrio phage VP-1]|uniref:Uncharacterized protein n=1 Tax=Vibrio phage VP-1 TaxID=2234088 RepID=A0A4P2THC2_9CAUD|nr:hypothetical protein [Vibrio phage VP-1]